MFHTEKEQNPRIEWKKKGKDVSFVYFDGHFRGERAAGGLFRGLSHGQKRGMNNESAAGGLVTLTQEFRFTHFGDGVQTKCDNINLGCVSTNKLYFQLIRNETKNQLEVCDSKDDKDTNAANKKIVRGTAV